MLYDAVAPARSGYEPMPPAPRRLGHAKAQLGEIGGRFQAVYLTMGAHELVFVYEVLDDAGAAPFLGNDVIRFGAQGRPA